MRWEKWLTAFLSSSSHFLPHYLFLLFFLSLSPLIVIHWVCTFVSAILQSISAPVTSKGQWIKSTVLIYFYFSFTLTFSSTQLSGACEEMRIRWTCCHSSDWLRLRSGWKAQVKFSPNQLSQLCECVCVTASEWMFPLCTCKRKQNTSNE